MTLWAGQFGIEDGEAKEITPWVGVYPDPGRAEVPSDLYVVVTPALPGSEEFCGEMKDVVGEAFHRTKLSVTGGILQALRGAHQNLRDWNRRSLQEHQVAAGVSCLAVEEERAYVAQVAPASACFYRAGELTHLRPELPEARRPLGLEDDFRPDFRRFDLEAGDRLLLLSPALAEVLDEESLRDAFSRTGEESLPLIYRKARDAGDCAALLLIAERAPEPARARR
jgi:hypothetical protein